MENFFRVSIYFIKKKQTKLIFKKKFSFLNCMKEYIFTVGYAAMTVTYFTSKFFLRQCVIGPAKYISAKIWPTHAKNSKAHMQSEQQKRSKTNNASNQNGITAAKFLTHVCMYTFAVSMDSGDIYSNFTIKKMFFQSEKTVKSTSCIIFTAGFLVLFDFCFYVLHRLLHTGMISRALFLPGCTHNFSSSSTQPIVRFATVTAPSFLVAIFLAKPPVNMLTPLSVVSGAFFALISEAHCLRRIFASNKEEHQICKQVGFGFSPLFDRLFKTDLRTMESSS